MTTTPSSHRRSSAAARRERLLEVATVEFAHRGYAGGSTERIARAAEISQPYVFRLFGSKLQLFLAVMERCFADTMAMFEAAARGHTGDDALDAIGAAYGDMIATRPEKLQCQLVGYAACSEPAVRDAMRRGYGELVEFVERTSGADADRVAAFFATGMLLNVASALNLREQTTPWGDRLLAACLTDPS